MDSDQNSAQKQEEMYEVQKILKKRIRAGKAEYKIKWKYWDNPEDLTWEPIENLKTVLDLVSDFEKNLTEEKEKEQKKLKRVQQEMEEKTRKIQKEGKIKKKKLFKRSEINCDENSQKQSEQKIPKKEEKNRKQSISSSSSESSSSSSASIEEINNKKINPKMKISRINYMIVKEGKPFYDVDIANLRGEVVGVLLMSSDDVKKWSHDALANFLKEKLIEIEEYQ